MIVVEALDPVSGGNMEIGTRCDRASSSHFEAVEAEHADKSHSEVGLEFRLRAKCREGCLVDDWS